LRYKLPRAFEVLFAVFGKERREARLVCEGAGGVVFGLEWIDLRNCQYKRTIARKSVGRTFHLSMSSVSQGFSFLCVDGMAAVVRVCSLFEMSGLSRKKFTVQLSCQGARERPLTPLTSPAQHHDHPRFRGRFP